MHNKQPEIKTHYRSCNICEAICGLEIKYQGNKILSIKGDKKDPLSQGHICPKGVALQDVYYDEDRLKQPLKKTNDGWKTISWDDAFDEVVAQIKNIQKKYGNDAVATYLGNPTVHNAGAMMFLPLFSKALMSKNRFSATSVDQLPDQLAAYLLFGHQLLVSVPDLDRIDCLLIIGANPVVSNGSMMTAPNVANRLKRISKRGGTIINVDPRFTQTSKISDQHVYINPGSDVYLLLAMVQQVFENNWVKLGHIEKFTHDMGEIKKVVAEYTPDQVSQVTGIDSSIIKQITKTFCQSKAACCYPRFGASTQQFGTLVHWLGNVLNIITGNFDREGCAMFSQPAVDILAPARKNPNKKVFAKSLSRVEKLPSFAGEFPVSTLATEITTAGDGQIKMLIINAGNPVLSTPNSYKMDKALASLDYMVSIDYYLNESSRHANIILPPTSYLERDHYDLAFHTLAIRNTAKFNSTLFEPDENQRSDKQIFTELWARLQPKGIKNKIKTSLTKRAIEKNSIQDIVAQGLQKGPYQDLDIQKLINEKHGVDLGALKPCMPERLFTKDKQIHLFPDVMKQDLKRLNLKTQNNQEYPLQLIGRRDPRTNNSWMHNSYRLVKGKPQCFAFINTVDAQNYQLEDGDEITVSSQSASINISIKITQEIKGGIICIPHGWGHDMEGTRLKIANAHAGINVNILMDETQRDELSGNAVLSGIAVKIKKTSFA